MMRRFLLLSLVFAANALQASPFFTLNKVLDSNDALTFIFVVNGDSFNAILTSEGGKPANSSRLDYEKIVHHARNSSQNVVILYDRLGRSDPFTLTTVTLEAFAGGRRLYRKATHELDLTDPLVWKSTLDFALMSFPKSKDFHLIYRGHGFVPEVEKFDFSSENSFDIKKFSQGLAQSRLVKSGRRLGSITFAACQMSYLEVALELMNKAEYVISSQIPVLQQDVHGFGFGFLDKKVIGRQQNLRSVVANLAHQMSYFLQFRSANTNVPYEYPFSLIKLSALRALARNDLDVLRNLGVEAGRQNPAILEELQVSKELSEIYIEEQRKNGVDESSLSQRKELLRRVVQTPKHLHLDVVSYLKAIGQLALADFLKDKALVRLHYNKDNLKQGMSFLVDRK